MPTAADKVVCRFIDADAQDSASNIRLQWKVAYDAANESFLCNSVGVRRGAARAPGSLSEGAAYVAAPLFAADHRRSQPSADARRQSGQVAPGAYHLVLRDLPARRASAETTSASTLLFDFSSIPITRRDRRPPGAAAAADSVAARRWMRSTPIAIMSIMQWTHLLPRSPPSQRCRARDSGINHEQQHQELMLTDIKHAVCGRIRCGPPIAAPRTATDPATPMRRAPMARAFRGRHRSRSATRATALPSTTRARGTSVFLSPFRLAARLVTNGEYLEFIADGGYRNPALWLSDGWATVREPAGRRRCTGSRRDGDWRTMTPARHAAGAILRRR